MDRETAENVLNDIKASAEERMRSQLEPKARAYGKSIDEMIDEQKMDNMIARKNAYKRLLERAETDQVIKGFKDSARKSASLGVLGRVGGVQSDVEGGRLSAAAVIKGEVGKAVGYFESNLAKIKNGKKYFVSKAYDEKIFRETQIPGSERDESIREIGALIRRMFSHMRKQINFAGGNIRELDGFVAKQYHDTHKMLSPTGNAYKDYLLRIKLKRTLKKGEDLGKKLRGIAYQRWRDFVRPLIDDSKTFKGMDDAQKEKFLSGFYRGVIEGHVTRPFVVDSETEKAFRVPSPGNYAKRLGAKRLMHFKKDGKSAYQYIKEYGDGSYTQAVTRTVKKMAHDYGIISSMTDNPMAWFHNMVRRVKDTYHEEALERSFQHNLDRARITLGHLLNEYARPQKSIGGKMLSGLMALKSMAALGLIVPRSFNDVAILGSKLSEYGDGYFSTYKNFLQTILPGSIKTENRSIAEAIGAMAHTIMADTHGRAHATDTPIEKISKLNQIFYKANLLNSWDNTLRSAGAGALARGLGRMKAKAFDDLPVAVRRNIANYGIKARDWDLIRAHAVKMPTLNHVITPDVIDNVPRSTLEKTLGKKFNSDEDAQTYLRQLNLKLSTLFHNEIDDMQIQPSVATRAAILGANPSDSGQAMALRAFAMFKMFSIEMTKRTLGRMIYGHGYSGFLNMIKNGRGSRMQLVNFIIQNAALAYIGSVAASLASGKTPKPLNRPETWTDLLLNSGGLGMYGSVIGGDYSSYGQSALTAIGGPVGGIIDDVAKLVSQTREDVVQRKSFSNVGKGAVRFLQGLTPGRNLPIVKMPLDYMFAHLLKENQQPGYWLRMQRKLKKDTGQSYIWPPS